MTKSNKFAIKFGLNCSSIMFGFSPKNINKTSFNYSSKGFYLLVDGGGYLYSQRGDNDKHIFDSCELTQGIIYGGFYNKKKKEIIFYKNNTELGVGYGNLKMKKKKKKN